MKIAALTKLNRLAQRLSGHPVTALEKHSDAQAGDTQFFMATLNALAEQLCVLDEAGTIIAVNSAWCEVAAANGIAVGVGANYFSVYGATSGELAAQQADFTDGVRAVLKGERAIFEFEYSSHNIDQQRWFIAKAVSFAECGAQRVVITHSEISERKRVEEQLLYQTHYDFLTGLPNRLLFLDRVKNALTQAHRNQWTSAVLFIDLDRFKVVNDTLGHRFGDQLIQLVAQRLITCLRDSDTICRLGGDEFAVLLPDLGATDDVGQTAQKIARALATPFDIGGNETFVTASIGIAVHPGDGNDVDTLIRNADAAMYSAKALGGNNYQFYNARMNELALERLRLESSLRHALERGEFLLHYQPKLAGSGGNICGAEALLRWNHPERGLVSPAEFVPLLEETGLILPVGLWVLEAACAQIRSWRDAGIEVPVIAINLSVRQFQQIDLDIRMRDIIEAAGIAPSAIELEITESMLMHNPQQAIAMLTKLKLLGVRISVDDFGTGYSSLVYLKQFPLDALKIDRAFISNLPAGQLDQSDGTIALAIINLAHSLNLKVVAEGVETECQARFLIQHGCDELQGFYFSRPIEPAALAQMLSDKKLFVLPPTACDGPCLLLLGDHNKLAPLEKALHGTGYRILSASTAYQAFELLANHRIAMVIADQTMQRAAGIEFLSHVQRHHPAITRIVHADLHETEMVAQGINNEQLHSSRPDR